MADITIVNGANQNQLITGGHHPAGFTYFSRQEVLVQHASAPLPHGVTLGVLNSATYFCRSKWCPGDLPRNCDSL